MLPLFVCVWGVGRLLPELGSSALSGRLPCSSVELLVLGLESPPRRSVLLSARHGLARSLLSNRRLASRAGSGGVQICDRERTVLRDGVRRCEQPLGALNIEVDERPMHHPGRTGFRGEAEQRQACHMGWAESLGKKWTRSKLVNR